MNEHRFTPGPWEMSPDGDEHCVAENDFWFINGKQPVGDEEHDANARLIAAAPELLLALVAARHGLLSYQHANDSPDLAEEMVEHIEAVLQKATLAPAEATAR